MTIQISDTGMIVKNRGIGKIIEINNVRKRFFTKKGFKKYFKEVSEDNYYLFAKHDSRY